MPETTYTDYRTTPATVFEFVGTFSCKLISGKQNDMIAAASMLEKLPPLDAVRLVLAASQRQCSVIGETEMQHLADFLGVYEEETDE